jgi:hypothetical protein
VFKAEFQVVLNMLTLHTPHHIKDAFQKGSSAENGAYKQKGTISMVLVASRPEVCFDQTAAPNPEIMGSHDKLIRQEAFVAFCKNN